jgi:hypothetical protein
MTDGVELGRRKRRKRTGISSAGHVTLPVDVMDERHHKAVRERNKEQE